jgi:hypothetical protein
MLTICSKCKYFNFPILLLSVLHLHRRRVEFFIGSFSWRAISISFWLSVSHAFYYLKAISNLLLYLSIKPTIPITSQ